MKVLILAGGFGTRISEYTESIPKPMVTLNNEPILYHIMNYYAHYGHKDFYIALGYKSEIIKEYFHNFLTTRSDFTIDLSNGSYNSFSTKSLDWKITLIDTGIDTMTGGRVKRMQKYIGNEPFMLTYGDGLSNVDLKKLEAFHNDHKKMVTVTAVRPVARFGELEIENNFVKSFKEKPQVDQGWINGGFFICNPSFFDFIKNDNTILEREPLEDVASQGQLMAFKHEGFWQCMDTKRDRDFLEELAQSNNAPWKIV